jgi:hypothetical protein
MFMSETYADLVEQKNPLLVSNRVFQIAVMRSFLFSIYRVLLETLAYGLIGVQC